MTLWFKSQPGVEQAAADRLLSPHLVLRGGPLLYYLRGVTAFMTPTTLIRSTVPSKMATSDNCGKLLDRALDAAEGLLRLTPTWVPRSFLHPGKRIKLHPDDWYAYGAHRGGIDERWFASTTEAANEGRVPDEGLSYVCFEGERFTLRDAVAEAGRDSSARRCSRNTSAGRCIRSSSTTWGRFRITCTRLRRRQARRPGRQARELLLPAAVQQRRQQFRLHVHGPRAGHDQGRRSASASKTGTRATTASSISRRPIA